MSYLDMIPTTKAQALQTLAHLESSLFISDLNSFDTGILIIPHSELVTDSRLGENKQKYITEKGHCFYLILDHYARVSLVARTIKTICKANNWTGELKRFDYLLKKYPEYFVESLKDRYIFS